MKKTLALLFLLFLTVISTAACKVTPSKDEPNGDIGDVIYGSGVPVTVVVPAESEYDFDYHNILSTIYYYTDRMPDFKNDSAAITEHEIAVGRTTRDITAKAYEKLNEYLEKMHIKYEDEGIDSRYIEGYAIYSDGTSVAIIWSDDTASSLAYNYFVEHFLADDTLVLQDGYINIQTFSVLDFYRDKEESKREETLASVESKYGAEVTQALRNHLSLFDEKFYIWLANLYEPGEYDENGNPLGGGFYYSNSGRDTIGYNIDLESTYQVLNFLLNSGMLAGTSLKEAMPEKIQNEITSFVLSCQSSKDGYFYHPQWGTDISDARRSRDLTWGETLLNYFGAKPLWTTPSGVTGTNGSPVRASSSSLSKPLSEKNVSKSVSQVVPVATWTGSPQLANTTEWENYIKGFADSIRTNSYTIFNTISAQASEIANRDKMAITSGELKDADRDGHADGGYIDILEKYFNDWQIEENGLWEECSIEDGTVYYNAINGLMKILLAYNTLNAPFPNADKAFECAAFMITYTGEGDGWADCKGKKPSAAVDVYNPWVALQQLINNVNKFGTSTEAVAMRKQIQDNAAAMIKATTQKVVLFHKDDGSYGYTWTTSPSKSQGEDVALPDTVEGDVNGGTIALMGIYNTMCSALGISAPKPYGYSDFMVFRDTLCDLGPVIKDPEQEKEVYPTTFDDDELGEINIDRIEGVKISLGEKGSAEIIRDPRGSGNILQLDTASGEGQSVLVNVATVRGARCFVLEWDMRFEEITTGGYTAFQVLLGRSNTAYMLTLGLTKEGVLTIGDASAYSSGVTNSFKGNYNAFEWNTFRVEYYVMDADENKTITKIFVNDQLRYVSTNYFGCEANATPSTTYKTAFFYALNSTVAKVQFDNITGYQTTRLYKEEEIFDPDRVKDFENVSVGTTMPNGVTTTGGKVVSSPTEENAENKIFVLDGNGKTVTIESTIIAAIPNCHTVSTKMKITSDSIGEIAKIYLAGESTKKASYAYRLEVYEDENGSKKARLVEFTKSDGDGNTYEGIPLDEWFAFSVDYYPNFYQSEASSIVRVNGIEIGRSNNYYYIGTVNVKYERFIISTTADITISIDDVIPESVSKKFVGTDGNNIDDPDVAFPENGKASSTPAASDHDGRFDFEEVELGTPSIPGLTTSVNTKEYGNNLDIVKDPSDAVNQVLMHRAASSSKAGNTTTFTASKLSPDGANCFVFSFDLYIGKTTSGVAQFFIKGKTSAGSVKNIFQTNTVIRGDEGVGTIEVKSKRDFANDLGTDTAVANTDIVSKTNVSGWTNIRYELYIDKGEVQIYYDNQFVGETNIVYTCNLDSVMSTCGFYTDYGSNCELYIDNVVAEAVIKEFTNPDRIKHFDNVPAQSDKFPGGVTTTGGEIVSEPTADNPENNIFVLDGADKSVAIDVTTAVITPNCHTVSTKIKIISDSIGEIAKVYLAGESKSKAIMAYSLEVYEDANGNKKARLVEFMKSGGVGNSYDGLPLGEWFTLSFDFYPNFYQSEASSIVRVNGIEIGRSNNYYYIGTIIVDFEQFIVTTVADVTISLDDIIPESVTKKFADVNGNKIDDPEVLFPALGQSSSTPATSGHDGMFDFDDTDLGVPKLPGLSTSVNSTEYGNNLEIIKDPTDMSGENQVFMHKTASSSKAGNTTTFIASKLSPEGANCYVFSYDYYISNVTSGVVQFFIKGQTSTGKVVNMFQTNTVIRGNGGVGTIEVKSKRDYAADLGTDSSTANTIIVPTKNVSGWVNVRYELYTDEGIVRIYYDDVLVGETDIVYNSNLNSTMYSCGFYTDYSSNCEILIDNVVAKAVIGDENQEDNPSNDDSIHGDSIDNDGWEKVEK